MHRASLAVGAGAGLRERAGSAKAEIDSRALPRRRRDDHRWTTLATSRSHETSSHLMRRVTTGRGAAPRVTSWILAADGGSVLCFASV